MIITTTQKIIKIGDSAGVTLPAKDLRQIGAKPGNSIKITYELIDDINDDVLQDYAAFRAQYGETLKNLASR